MSNPEQPIVDPLKTDTVNKTESKAGSKRKAVVKCAQPETGLRTKRKMVTTRAQAKRDVIDEKIRKEKESKVDLVLWICDLSPTYMTFNKADLVSTIIEFSKRWCPTAKVLLLKSRFLLDDTIDCSITIKEAKLKDGDDLLINPTMPSIEVVAWYKALSQSAKKESSGPHDSDDSKKSSSP